MSAGSKFVRTLAISPMRKAITMHPIIMTKNPAHFSPNVIVSASPIIAFIAQSSAAT